MRYWLVGASWGGQDHQDQFSVKNGYWMPGRGTEDQPEQFKRGEQIQVGDRVTIKRMRGQGSPEIRILHIGIVKDVIAETDKVICAIDWIVIDLDRGVENRGYFKSVHGPYDKDEWIERIFCL